MQKFLQIVLFLGIIAPVAGQPNAYLTPRDTELCIGDSVVSDLVMTGDGPWTVVINNSDGVYRILPDIKSPYLLWLKSESTTTFSVASVEDRFGTSGLGYGSIKVDVFPFVPVDIVMDQTSYLKNDPGVSLVSNPPGADFFGEGVIGSIFLPGVATPTGSPHEISCIYTNSYECKSYDTIDVHVIHGEAEVVLMSGADIINTVCDENAGYEIVGSNLDGLSGLFTIREIDSPDFLSGYIVDEDSSDNKAEFHPKGISGSYELVYTCQFDVHTITATQIINVNDLESLTIDGFPDVVCMDHDPYALTPGNITVDPDAVYKITGPGVSGTQSDGYYFDPGSDDVPLGNSTIQMEYTSSNGCYVKVNRSVNKHFTPEVSFSYTPSCLSSNGGTVSFTNTSTGKYAVEEGGWIWDFGDPDSGDQNHSNEINPQHQYATAGTKLVSLSANTVDGCVSVLEQDAIFSDQPMADFTWLHDCYYGEGEISFQNRTVSNFSTIKTLEWTFMTEEGLTIGGQTSLNPEHIVRFRFPDQDNYRVQLKVWDQAGCSGQVTKVLSLRPNIPLTSSGYTENFNGNPKTWTSGANDQSSWVLGEPNFTGYETIPGNYAWYTELPSGDSEYIEHSWVESPCFDFSQSAKPFLNMNLMKSFNPGLDGAVLQYLEGTGQDWITLGVVGEGVDWYNVSNIANEPGGSTFGWGMDQFEPDTDWKNAKYSLNELIGKKHVKFRIAMASGGTSELGNQGFAFDNFAISEDFRGSVLEHFTNSSQAASRIAGDVVDGFALGNRATVVDIQYHTDYPGNDPMNDNNPYPASTRLFQTGVDKTSVPIAILNGSHDPDFRYDFTGSSEMPDEEILHQESLKTSPFQLDLQVDWTGDNLEATATTICTADAFAPNVNLYMVVMETSVTAYTGENGDSEFRNVVLDMLPDPTGKLLGGEWILGESVTKTYAWDYPAYVEDVEDLAVVAFLTDRDNNGVILQAAATYLTPQVGVKKSRKAPEKLAVFPNPASHMVYVNIGNEASKEGRMIITDLTGRMVLEAEVQPGYSIFRLDVATLPEGMYMINWLEAGALKGQSKLIRTR